MDEAYRRWHHPKSRSSFRRRALVSIGYVYHRFRRAFVKLKSYGAVMSANLSLSPLLSVLARVPVMPLVSTIVLSPLIAVPLYNCISAVNVLRSSVNHSLSFSQSVLYSNNIESFLFGAYSSGVSVSIVL